MKLMTPLITTTIAVAALSFSSPAFAQQELEFVPDAASHGHTHSNDEEQQFISVLEQAFRDRDLQARNSDATFTESLESQEDEVKKVFRYKKKSGIFDESELPQRTFNNIEYPY